MVPGGAEVVDLPPSKGEACKEGQQEPSWGSRQRSPGAEKPWREGGMGMETKSAVQQGAGLRPRCGARGANEKLLPEAPGGRRGGTAHASGHAWVWG